MIKKVIFSILIITVLTYSLFGEKGKEESETTTKGVEVLTTGQFTQSFTTGVVDSKISKAFDYEAFESLSKVNGEATIIFGLYALSFALDDEFTTYYTTDTNIMSYKNYVAAKVGNDFILSPNLKLFVDFKTTYEHLFIASTETAGILQLIPIMGIEISMEMFKFSISEGVPFSIDLENSALSLVEIDGLYTLSFHSGFGLDAIAQYNIIAPVDPQGQTGATLTQELKTIVLWPIQSLQPQAGVVMFNDKDNLVWGFCAGLGIINDLWQITGEYKGGYNFTDKHWENIFVASFSLSM